MAFEDATSGSAGTAAWDRFERGDGVGRAVLQGIDDCSSPRVGLRVPGSEEDAAHEAARVCPAGAITISAEERYDPWRGPGSGGGTGPSIARGVRRRR